MSIWAMVVRQYLLLNNNILQTYLHVNKLTMFIGEIINIFESECLENVLASRINEYGFDLIVIEEAIVVL